VKTREELLELIQRAKAGFSLLRMLSDRYEISGGSVANLPNIFKISREMELDLKAVPKEEIGKTKNA
jgi:hypothetical protein